MGIDRAPIEFQTFYFSHVLVPPSIHAYIYWSMVSLESFMLQEQDGWVGYDQTYP